MMKGLIPIVFAFLCSPLTDLFALELFAYPQKAPICGMNLSKGVVVVRETGEIKSLSSGGFCTIEVSPDFEQITVDVFVPGFQAAGGVFDSMATAKLPLFLQSFVGDKVVFDLGKSAAMVLSARAVLNDAVKEAAESTRTENPNDPPDTAPATINPFYIIELIVGKSLSEILGQ